MPIIYQSRLKQPAVTVNNMTEDGSETEVVNNKIVVPYNARLSDKNH